MKHFVIFGRILLFTSMVVFASLSASASPVDSQEANDLLAQAKTEALQLRHDAEDLSTYTRSRMTWQSQSAKVDEMKQHVNKCGELVSELQNIRTDVSPWQQQAIDRINPLLSELAAGVSTTIEHINKHPDQLWTNTYRDYVQANADMATNLAQVISDFVEYGKSKAKSDELADKLEVPGNQ